MVTIATYLGLLQNLRQFYNPHTYSKTLVKIGPVVVEIFGEICRCLLSHPKRCICTLVISGVTGPIFIIFANNVANILPLNIFESDWRYRKPFSNATLPYERIYPNFDIKLIIMATSDEESEKEARIFLTPIIW